VLRFYLVGALVVAGALVTLAAVIGSAGWWVLLGLIVLLVLVGVYDLVQKRHSILRNYPVLGHMRFLLEGIRPELQQYFIERNYDGRPDDGRPYDRDTRTVIYERAKGIHGEQGSDIVKRVIQGADYANAARAMMMAVGCIQAQRCHTNTCPVGVTTQDPRRARALDVGDKSLRVQRFQDATVRQAAQLIASMGLTGPVELSTRQLRRRIDHTSTKSYAELFDWLDPDELLHGPPQSWVDDWESADPDRF
jgi:hypothetical protein